MNKKFWIRWDMWLDRAEKEFVNKTGATMDTFSVCDDGSVVISKLTVPVWFPPKTVTPWEQFMLYGFLKIGE